FHPLASHLSRLDGVHRGPLWRRLTRADPHRHEPAVDEASVKERALGVVVNDRVSGSRLVARVVFVPEHDELDFAAVGLPESRRLAGSGSHGDGIITLRPRPATR